MVQLCALVAAGAAVSFLRCARDCFGSCPIYLGASECCGPRSFCGWAAEPPVKIPVGYFKTHLQTIRGNAVPLECNVNAEPYLSLGSSLSTCSLSALEISNDQSYNGQPLSCDFVRRVQIGNASLAACQEAIAEWGSSFGITSAPAPRPTAQPTRGTTSAGTTATAGISVAGTPSPTTIEKTAPRSANALNPTNSTDASQNRPPALNSVHIILIVAIVFCIFLNIALAIGLQKHRATARTDSPEPDIASNDTWDDPDPIAMANPMYAPAGELDPTYVGPAEAVYEEPLYDASTTAGTVTVYDTATGDNLSDKSNC